MQFLAVSVYQRLEMHRVIICYKISLEVKPVGATMKLPDIRIYRSRTSIQDQDNRFRPLPISNKCALRLLFLLFLTFFFDLSTAIATCSATSSPASNLHALSIFVIISPTHHLARCICCLLSP